jgi:HK97 family phage major capsid protein
VLFRSGEYFTLIKRAAYGNTDERLVKINKHLTKAAAGANETTNADGGYAVPVIYANKLWDDLVSDESLFGDVFSMTLTTGSSLKLPRDNNTAIGSYGVSATWLGAAGTTHGEAIQIPTSKPNLGQITLQLNDLGVLCPITSDLAEDNNVALEQYIMTLSGRTINWKVNDAIVNGNSGTPTAGTPTGFVGHAGTVSADRGTANTNTITYTNMVQMLSQFVGDPSKARWLYNRAAIPQILNASDGAGRNLYYAPGTLGDKPYGTLLGIRAQACDHMAALGSAADIALVDLSQYFAITKGAPNMAMSIHLYFDTNQLAYRWIFRMDGQPVRQSPFTQGGVNYGYMVTLGAKHS